MRNLYEKSNFHKNFKYIINNELYAFRAFYILMENLECVKSTIKSFYALYAISI